MKRSLLLSLAVLLPVFLLAETHTSGQPLPRHLVPHEYGLSLPNADDPTPPPDEPCRTITEWEESEAVIFRWGSYNSILSQIIDYVVNVTKAYIICANQSQVSSCRSYLEGQGVAPMDSVEFMIQATNSVWIRDYAPWWLWRLESWDRAMYEWDYNRPRPLDDVIPEWLSELWGIEYYGLDLTHTGGNWLLDGWSRAYCSELILLENWGLTTERVTELFSEYCSLDSVPLCPTFFGIDHMNMYVKLVNEHTVIINQYPDGSPYNDEMEEIVQQFTGLNAQFGRPFDIYRVQTPNWFSAPYTYCNSLIANNRVVVPVYNMQPYDNDAIALYEEILPGYDIFSVNCNGIIGASGAINCITHNIPHPDLIYITHDPLPDTPNVTEPYRVACDIVSLGTLNEDSLRIHWRSDQNPEWTEETLSFVSGDEFEAYIPPSSGGQVEYYIYAQNVENNWTTMPRYGPEAHYEFQAGPYDLELTLTPENPPIVIPAGGGSFSFNVEIVNTAAAARNFDVWFQAVLPSMDTVTTFLRENLVLAENSSIIRNISQNVPAGAPAGNYTFRAVCGAYPNLIYSEDSFPFEKSAAEGGGEVVDNWNLSGWDSPMALETVLPGDYQLRQNYPNPFNPVTSIDFALPHSGRVTLTVFNIAGQEVARLADDHFNAGWHSLEWNSHNLPSGIYFCRLQAPGFTAVRKMMLMK